MSKYLHDLLVGFRVELKEELPLLGGLRKGIVLEKGLKGKITKLAGTTSMLVVVAFDSNQVAWVDSRKLEHILNTPNNEEK